VYLALYGPEGLVIFDHPYNAEYLRLAGEQIGVAVARGLLVRRQLANGERSAKAGIAHLTLRRLHALLPPSS
jgi:hypothetical protein